jgi:glycosyltransferase involved in cell wall biosynthesis
MWENARYLASVGHDVTFVAASFRGAAHEAMVDGIKVVRLGGIHSLWFRSFAYYVLRGGRTYDVVVAEGFGGSRIPRLAPLYVKQPVLTEWHQIHRQLFAAQYPRLLNGPLNLLEHLTARIHRNTRVRVGTEEWKRAFPGIGFKLENLFVVPVSIRDEWLDEQNGSPTPEPTILWLGKIRRYKCPDHVIRAMANVVKQVDGAHLIIAGRRDDAAYESELRRSVDRLGLEGSVEFRFDVPERDKRELMRSARVLVVTSAVEGFGIVVLEANACGVPVIASTGVPPSVVRDGVNGLRYPFGDWQSLGEKIVRLLRDDELHSHLSQNASTYARRFRWSRVGAEFEQVVARTAAGSRATQAE